MVVLSDLTPSQRISDDTGHPFVIVTLSSTNPYTPEDKKKIIEFMKKGTVCSAGGYVYDIVRKEETRIEGVGYDDGQYSWDSQDIYHIEKYNGTISKEFLKHIFE